MTQLTVTALAAGGDGVARDEGRVTFVPRTAPGDVVEARIVKATKSFARGELVRVVTPSPHRVPPPCPAFARGCGGCSWQHVTRAEQLAAKHAIVASALRKLGIPVEPVVDPAPALGWRRRARFHVARGRIGLYVEGTHQLLALEHCPQLEPALDTALEAVRAARPPDGELALLLGQHGEVMVGTERAWQHALVGRAGIVGVIAGGVVSGVALLEIEPGLWTGPHDFAQASIAGNAALVAHVGAQVGAGSGLLVELYAGAGNFTRSFLAAGWRVIATDGAPPARPVARDHRTGNVAEVLAGIGESADVVVLDPPRAGAADAIAGIVQLAPQRIVYIACDPATLARDCERLVAAGYRATLAVPFDLMPQTAHVEVVVTLSR